MKYLKLLLVINITLFVKVNLEAETSMQMIQPPHKTMSLDSKHNRVDLEEKYKNQVINVLKKNEELHSSFFDYNASRVESKANELKQEISQITHPEISKLLAFSSKKLNEINASNSRSENNRSYHLVSMALIYLINKYNLGNQYNTFSCPMLKMKWIQNTKKISKIHNPYAPKMPHCGTQDTNY